MSESYAETLARANLNISGINEHKEALAIRGINETHVEKIKSLVQAANEIDAEQERFKGLLKETTSKLRQNMKELRKVLNEVKKVVKLDINQDRWKDFGIQDKH